MKKVSVDVYALYACLFISVLGMCVTIFSVILVQLLLYFQLPIITSSTFAQHLSVIQSVCWIFSASLAPNALTLTLKSFNCKQSPFSYFYSSIFICIPLHACILMNLSSFNIKIVQFIHFLMSLLH